MMKLLKVSKEESTGHYSLIVDRIPDVTYEQIKRDYVGSTLDDEGNILFSNHLVCKGFSGAFGGRVITLQMKDGTFRAISGHWWHKGSYSEHGYFVSVGIGTVETLNNCYVYRSMSINKMLFDVMLQDYYKNDITYDYEELREWCRAQ